MTGRYGAAEDQLTHYTCLRTPVKPRLDGRLDGAPWTTAPRSPRFVDLVTGEPGFFDTRIASVWDDEALYLGFWMEEPNLQARLTARDSFIYIENDVEVFIGGEDCYYEFEINALGTVYEVFYIWQDALRRGSRFDRPEFDLLAHPVDVLGGFQDALRNGRHPRGRRWAFMDWDFPGLRTAVHADGTLNDSSDIDRGWTVELAFPWSGMRSLFGNRPLPPRDGDILRVDCSRFEHLKPGGRELERSIGWALNTHGIYDSHIPEAFSCFHFSSREVDVR